MEEKEPKKEMLVKKENVKEKKTNRFVEFIKKKWLVKGTTMFLLIAIIVGVFIGIDWFMHSLELTPLDFSQEKLYTLTEDSKEKVRNIDKDIKILFFNYLEDDATVTLAKQYEKTNEKIKVELLDVNARPDLVEKYGISEGYAIIVIECGEKTKLLSDNDLITYDTTTYETINIAEEKLTSSILNVASDEIPKIYFLQGYSEFSLTTNMYFLNSYLENEVNEIDTLNIISTGKVPEDCKTLVITTPNKDFDEITTNSIKDYINKGGNILWLNEAITLKVDFPNINSILELYGINPFEEGIILETDASKMATESPYVILPQIEYTTITKNLNQTQGVVLVNATKINVDEEKLENQKVEKTDLITTDETSFFRKNFEINSFQKQENEESGSFVIGAEFDKTIKEANEETGEAAKTSKLILIGENAFISDYSWSQNSQYPLIQELQNKDIVLNSIAYLADRQEDITARKNTGMVTYTPTEEQHIIILCIIFIVPVVIIVLGIVVWILRRRKK